MFHRAFKFFKPYGKENLHMKIEIFDPAMCCPSGVCGPSVDPALVKLQETLRILEEKCAGRVQVSRHGLSSDPQAFVAHVEARKLLQEEGPQCLPLTFFDGQLVASRAYLSTEKFQQALKERGVEVELGPKQASRSCCGSGCC
jgi:hypothetical protein